MNKLIQNVKIIVSLWKQISSQNLVFDDPVNKFERELTSMLGISNVISVASGTDALILSLKALGIGPGDEVIVPPLSFFSTAGAVAWVSAKPVFVDIEEKNLNIDASLIERAITPKTKAIIAVHLNGCMADMEKISAIAKKHNLFLIEDAAQAIRAKYKGKPPGFYGDVACFSFNPQKVLTAGGDGGAIVTNNPDIAEKVKLLRNYGAKFEEISFSHSMVGTASHLSPFHAAVMNVKMLEIDAAVNDQRKNYYLYSDRLRDIKEITLPEIPDDKEYFINGYRYVILASRRGELLQFLKKNKVDARTHYSVLLPYFDAFRYLECKKGDFPVAEKISEEVLILPTDESISEKEISRITDLIKNFIKTT